MTYAARDANKLVTAQESILSCQDFSTLERDVLMPAAECLDAATSCFIRFRADPVGGIRFGRTATLNVPDRAHQGYLAHHFHGDPAMNVANRNLGSAPYVFCTSEIFDYRKLVNTGFYNDFFRPTGIHHVLVMAQRPHDRSADMLMYGFHRPRNDRPFGATEKQRLQQLASALGCSARLLSLQDDMAEQTRAIGEYESAHPEHGLLFLDQQMVVTYANEAALRHMALRSTGETICHAALLRACRRSLRTGETIEAIPIGDRSGAYCVGTLRSQLDCEGRPFFIVHTNRDSDETLFSARCRQYQLSPREVDITRALASGLSNAEISNRLFISVRTVENHLRSIYLKAGVHRRTQLLSRFNDLAERVASQ